MADLYFNPNKEYNIYSSNVVTREVLFEKYNPKKFVIYSIPVQATPRKLRAIWTPELAQDIEKYQSIDAEAELTNLLNLELNHLPDIQTRKVITEKHKDNSNIFWWGSDIWTSQFLVDYQSLIQYKWQVKH